MMQPTVSKWPKVVPALTQAQEEAREAWMMLWHEQLPNKFGVVEKFNHGFPAGLPVRAESKTLEVGPGIGGHLEYEDLAKQEYSVLEYREEFCKRLAEQLSQARVHQGSIEERQVFADGAFDRVIAIHVLEHLRNLPAALDEIDRLLSRDGVFDIVLPCEGGLAYDFARRISSKRMFEKHFAMSYDPIIRAEHVNTLAEVKQELFKRFRLERRAHFPLLIPVDTINLCVGYRLKHL